jgi:hypothetical protein
MVIDECRHPDGINELDRRAGRNSEDLNLIAFTAVAAAYAGHWRGVRLFPCPSPGAKIGAGAPTWPISNRNYRRDETGTV